MKLSKEDIQIIKSLIAKRGFTHVDVQYEILDHVACKIEALREENPNISIEEAFKQVQFYLGFSVLEDSYMALIQKRVWSNIKSEAKALFSSIQILYPLGLFTIIYLLANLLRDRVDFWLVFLTSLVLFTVAKLIYFFIKYHFKQKDLRKYRSYQISSISLVGTAPFLQFYIHAMNYIEKKNPVALDHWLGGIFIFAILVWITYSFIIDKVLNKTVQETKKLQELYQELN